MKIEKWLILDSEGICIQSNNIFYHAECQRTIKNPSQKVSRKQKDISHVSFKTANPLIQKEWNKKLTLKQNYAKMGILNSLNGVSGGSQYQVDAISPKSTRNQHLHTNKNISTSDNISRAMAVGAISMIDEEGDHHVIEPVGLPENNIFTPKTQLGRRIDSSRIQTSFPKNKTFIDSLIAYAATETIIQRQSSHQEVLVMIELIAKHGLDYDEMSKDIKLNKYQFSAGQLKRKVATLERSVEI